MVNRGDEDDVVPACMCDGNNCIDRPVTELR